MNYLLITCRNVAFCQNIDELYGALQHRHTPQAMLYTDDKWDSLLDMAKLWQSYQYDVQTDPNNPFFPIALPSTINKSTYLVSPQTQSNVSVETNNYAQQYEYPLLALQRMENNTTSLQNNEQTLGEWAIFALNGFCTAKTDIDLCQLLAGESLVYPIAQFVLLPHEKVVIFARNNYVQRFYKRYHYDAEQTSLPHCWLEQFQDSYFQQREERRTMFPEKYNTFQMKRMDMGW